jgi:ribose/xylose/arabinose/galactoside ABC-type transport system permease subunit
LYNFRGWVEPDRLQDGIGFVTLILTYRRTLTSSLCKKTKVQTVEQTGKSKIQNRKSKIAWPVETGVAVVLILLTLWFAWTFPDFRTGANASVILSGAAELAIVAAGMTLVIATGGIDISVGSVVGLCGIALGKLAVERHWPLWGACAACVAAGAACGAVNGLLVARFRLPPIIATLATFSAARAGAYVLSQGNSISGLPDAMTDLGLYNWLGVPRAAWIAAGALLVCGILLKKTAFGRGVLALGGNRDAAYLSGLPTRRTEAFVYVLSGLLAGVAAIIVTARGATAIPDAGKYFELSAITAVVMGGTPVSGGRATMIGTTLGILTIGVVQNGVMSYGKDATWGMLVLAFILLASVEVDRLRTKGVGSRV